MSVRTYVCTSTIKHNAATNQILEFVRVDETFTKMTFKVIRGQGQGHVRLKVSKMTIFKICLLRHFSTDQKKIQRFLILYQNIYNLLGRIFEFPPSY